MLRKVIATDERIHCLPEVFNSTYDARDDFPSGIPYYFEFLEQTVREDPAKCHPDAASGIVSAYFRLIAARMEAAGRTALVDVKYNSLNHADGTWRSPGTPPEMLRLFSKQSFPILHLRRRNLVRLAFSLLRAHQTRAFVAEPGDEVSAAAINVNVPGFLFSLKDLKTSDELFCRWLQLTGADTLELVYEDLFEEHPGSAFDREPFERIAGFFKFKEMRFDLVAKTQKLAPQDLRNEISNFDELNAALRGTEYEPFLHSP